MKTVIYADILVFINIAVNYFLLRAAARITSSDFKAFRLLLASLLGGLYSFVIFVDGIPDALVLLINILFSAVITFVAFEIVSVKSFLKKFGAFFLSHFCFAGIMMMLCTFVIPNASIYKNGAVYFDIDILTLTVSTLFCYALVSVISKFIRSKTPSECYFDAEIQAFGKTAKCRALLDTGNALCDCFSGRPVMICEMSVAKKLFPCENEYYDLTEIKGFRLIPYSTVSSSGALPAFPVDRLKLSTPTQTGVIEKIFVAVTEKKLISGDYSALIGIQITDGTQWMPTIQKERGKHYEKADSENKGVDFKNSVKAFQHGNKLHKRSGYSACSADGGKGIGMPAKIGRGR